MAAASTVWKIRTVKDEAFCTAICTRVTEHFADTSDCLWVCQRQGSNCVYAPVSEEKGVRLNTPPFMENRQQLPAEEVQCGRGIASLRIYVERAIGRVKNYRIIGTTFLVSVICLADMVVPVCAWLTNFEPVLVLPPVDDHEEDTVDQYFKSVFDSESEC